MPEVRLLERCESKAASASRLTRLPEVERLLERRASLAAATRGESDRIPIARHFCSRQN